MLMRITKATEENSHLPKGMNGSYVSKQNENRAGETKKKTEADGQKAKWTIMALWNLVYSRTSDLQDDPGLQRGFKSIYARFSENYLKENGENT